MSALTLAAIGGLASFATTSFGSLLTLFSNRKEGASRWNLSVDFALGLMVSASAFTLIGPAALNSYGTRTNVHLFSVTDILMIALLGALFIYFLKFQIHKFSQNATSQQTSHLILASVLMLHNFPEGLASGSVLAGLDLKSALPILGGIGLQNIPEGFLMVICLKSLNWSPRSALAGGLGSGVVEFLGALLAGILLNAVDGILPALLSFAGGSMMASVIIEMTESKESFWKISTSKEFALGFLILPLIQFMFM